MKYFSLFSLTSNNLTNYKRRNFKLLSNCHVSWDTLQVTTDHRPDSGGGNAHIFFYTGTKNGQLKFSWFTYCTESFVMYCSFCLRFCTDEILYCIEVYCIQVQYRDLGTKDDQLKSSWYTVDGNIDPPIRNQSTQKKNWRNT